MQVLTGNRYDITMMEWQETLDNARARLERSRKCFELFGDEDSRNWVKEDEAAVRNIENTMALVEKRLRENGFRPSSEQEGK